MRPDRIVIGGIDRRSQAVQEELYRDFAGTPVLRTSNATAEFIKYGSNALLATLISFCERDRQSVRHRARRRRGRGDARRAPDARAAAPPARRRAQGRPASTRSSSPAAASAAAACPRTSRRWRPGGRRGIGRRRCSTPCSPSTTASPRDDGRHGRAGAGRPARQERGRARPRLQARHRRCARIAGLPDHRRADRPRRRRPRVRSGRQRDRRCRPARQAAASRSSPAWTRRWPRPTRRSW